MPITEILERNAREYAQDVCLVEINPEIQENNSEAPAFPYSPHRKK